MKLWSSIGWREEVDSREEAAEIVDEAKAYRRQKITLSWLNEQGEQQDEVLYNGEDETKEAAMLDMIKQSRELEGGNRS